MRIQRSNLSSIFNVFRRALFVVVALIISVSLTLAYQQDTGYKVAKALPGELTISDITPSIGPAEGGTQVAINGSGFINQISWRQISAGEYHTCGISTDNQAYCWGLGGSGQLGGGDNISRSVPTPIDTTGVLAGLEILSISASLYHTCAIASDEQVYCWGLNNYGQLGNGVTGVNENVPVAVENTGTLGGKMIRNIHSSGDHTCVIAEDSQAYCWGRDNRGQLGDGGPNLNQSVPVAVDTSGALSGKNIVAISAGSGHTCAIADDDQAYCWGSDNPGQLGDGGPNLNQSVPVAVDTSGALSGKNIAAISASYAHTCATTTDGQAYCWGANTYGQLGDGTNLNQSVPVAVDTSGALFGKNIATISAGRDHTCAVSNDGIGYCWGRDSSGQLGDGGTYTDQPTPAAVDTSDFLSSEVTLLISTSSTHSCAKTDNGQAYCWGRNSFGKLGDGGISTFQPSPALVVSSFENIHSVSVDGIDQAFTILSDSRIELTMPAHDPGVVTVAVTDAEGEVAEADFKYLGYPSFTITSPSETMDMSPELTGTVNDPNDTILVAINGKTYTATNNGDGTWVLYAGTIEPLPAGQYTVLVTVINQLGNTTSLEVVLGVLTSNENSSQLAETGMNLPVIVATIAVAMVGSTLLFVFSRH